MANTNHITITDLHMTIHEAFDVTINDGVVVLHTPEARIRLSPAVVAHIDQARAEAQADTHLDANRTAAP